MHHLAHLPVFVLLAAIIALAIYFPRWYRKRLIRKVVDEAIAENKLDDSSRDEITGMLKTGKYLDIIDWMRRNEDKFPGELLAITKKKSLVHKRICRAVMICFILYIVLGPIVARVYAG